MNTTQAQEVQGGPKVTPVFFKQGDVLNYKEKPINTLEVCRAAEAVAGSGSIEGAQVIRGLWRIYCQTNHARQKLLDEKMSMRNILVDIYDTNPFVKPFGESTYLAIHDIPLSYDNNEIKKWLVTHGFPPASDIKYQFARDENNKLTSFKTGSRFVYVEGDASKIPDKAQIGLFTAKLWHPGLKQKQKVMKCSNCLQEGHTKTTCKSEVVCLICKQPGHRRGECPMEPEVNTEIQTPAATLKGSIGDVDRDTLQQVSSLLSQMKAQPATSAGTRTTFAPPRRGRGYPRYRSTRKRVRSGQSIEEMFTKKTDSRRTPVSHPKANINEEDWGTDSDADHNIMHTPGMDKRPEQDIGNT